MTVSQPSWLEKNLFKLKFDVSDRRGKENRFLPEKIRIEILIEKGLSFSLSLSLSLFLSFFL
jgi:hypothetical protein